jgi:hypothetical protein
LTIEFRQQQFHSDKSSSSDVAICSNFIFSFSFFFLIFPQQRWKCRTRESRRGPSPIQLDIHRLPLAAQNVKMKRPLKCSSSSRRLVLV